VVLLKTAERGNDPYTAKGGSCNEPKSKTIREEYLNGRNATNNGDFGENQKELYPKQGRSIYTALPLYTS
jgi:hypothetical protein